MKEEKKKDVCKNCCNSYCKHSVKNLHSECKHFELFEKHENKSKKS